MGEAPARQDDQQMLALMKPVDETTTAFREAELAWQANPDPNGGNAELVAAAQAAAAAHKTFAEQVAAADWSPAVAATALAVGRRFGLAGDSLAELGRASDFTQVAVGECHVSVAFLAAAKQYIAYVEQITGNPATGEVVDNLPANEMSARICKYRVPLLEATDEFNTSMATADSAATQIKALAALADAEDSYLTGVGSDSWPSSMTAAADDLVKAYESERDLLRAAIRSIRDNDQAALDATLNKLQKSYLKTEAAENALGTEIRGLASSG